MNKKIKSIMLYSLVGIFATSSCTDANQVDVNVSTVEDSSNNLDDNVNSNEILSVTTADINKLNIGKVVKIKATVESLEEKIINIKDSNGTAKVYLKDVIIEDLHTSDLVTITGIINTLEDEIYLFVDSIDNFQIEKEEIEDEDNKEDKENVDSSNGQLGNQVTGSQSGVINGLGVSLGQNSSLGSSSSSIKQIYARNYVTISRDLTSSEWDKIKTAIENNKIKVVDLKNNKIRIKCVSSGYGDRVWIVNDPRNLDIEIDEVVLTAGEKLLDSIDYTKYDITSGSWETIVEKVKSGSAKLKEMEEGNLKVIYSKDNKVDSTVIIYKK